METRRRRAWGKDGGRRGKDPPCGRGGFQGRSRRPPPCLPGAGGVRRRMSVGPVRALRPRAPQDCCPAPDGPDALAAGAPPCGPARARGRGGPPLRDPCADRPERLRGPGWPTGPRPRGVGRNRRPPRPPPAPRGLPPPAGAGGPCSRMPAAPCSRPRLSPPGLPTLAVTPYAAALKPPASGSRTRPCGSAQHAAPLRVRLSAPSDRAALRRLLPQRARVLPVVTTLGSTGGFVCLSLDPSTGLAISPPFFFPAALGVRD